MAVENWEPVVGHEGSYEVSDLGRVRSISRTMSVPSGNGRLYERSLRGRVLKLSMDRGGYLACCLWFGHVRRIARAHVLVLEAFVGARPDGRFGCHRDGNPANNSVSNLYWGTQKENMQDAIRHGTMRRGERISFSKLKASEVVDIRRMRSDASQSELSRRFGVTQSHISRIQNFRAWTDGVTTTGMGYGRVQEG